MIGIDHLMDICRIWQATLHILFPFPLKTHIEDTKTAQNAIAHNYGGIWMGIIFNELH